MQKSSFLSEWKQILANKKVLIPIIAVVFVPLMYAGMFLWAFWDPYDYLRDLPVAVVNEDAGADYEGENLELGKELVDKLKDNDQFQFHFATKKDGYRDLENRKYYMLIEIPKNFSENATTLMDEKPKKLELKYVPNEAYNFLSSQIGETAAKEIRAEVAKAVTSTYAETMFDKVGDVADGLEKASDGSGKLDKGAKELADGSKELKDNLEVLASSSIEFENGVTKARSGTDELADGSRTLAGGMDQLSDASNKLASASKDVEKGSKALNGGISQVENGLQEVNGKMPDLVAGTGKVQDGLKQLQNQLPKQMADAIGAKINASSGEMNAGLDQLNQGIKGKLENDLVNELSGQLSAGVAKGAANNIENMQKEQMNKLSQALLDNGIPQEKVQGIISQVTASSPSKEQIEQSMANQLKPQVEAGIKQGMSQATAGIDNAFSLYKGEVNKKLGGSTAGLDKEIQKAIDPVFDQLSNGLGTIQSGQVALQKGVSQLSNGAKELSDGSSKLSSGQQEYVKNMELFRQKMREANSGAHQLSDGANELSNGMGQLADGSSKIKDGSQKLADGSGKLSDGTSELHDGTAELHEKLSDAAEEASSVEANDDTYDMMGNPVKVDKEEVNPVPNYGTGFAPYFISLGLFVGALLMTIVFNLREPAIKPRNGIAWFLGKFGVVAVTGIIQALLVDAVLIFGLGIEVKSVPLFIFVSIITSITFMTMIQLLVTTLGDPGRFIAIVILILQLTTSAGTFPLELIPKMLQSFNNLLPMTYTVQAFKAVISSGDYSFMWHNIGILALYILVCTALTVTYFIIKNKKTNNQHAETAA
ncbi:YhgE/Pip domain-containing protein [Siminovitchia fortis]|uniref:YhgE/Pip domain-containing protein n=1 Tax=Siminovitchia fortis TaxID=254758 RepID=A0A443IWP9_9BACI|nr:YhgE/Pip domain-containing protein [Siminovitchia fortis]RWR12603.1 YhgE/Pip domain-containing protein [Siminovitchia fortis]WHY81449.1 YhgE/Pip domain-containing protein [Siminovitchia fortis]